MRPHSLFTTTVLLAAVIGSLSVGANGSNYALQCPVPTTTSSTTMPFQCQATTTPQCQTTTSPQCPATTSVGYTLTMTTSYGVTASCCGNLQVMFDSIQLTSSPPQAYSFNVNAKAAPGNWITMLIWQFGDGSGKSVPYCCQNDVSDAQYHAYSQPGPYTVVVYAIDNAGNSGYASVTVNWVTPVPEYSAYFIPIMISLAVTLVGIAVLKKKH